MFHTIDSTRRESSWRIHVVRGKTDKTAGNIQARSSMARALEINGKACQTEGKANWSNEKLHPDNARKLRGIHVIDHEDTEFKETIKNARKKLETSVAPAMPCKIMKNCGSGASDKIQTELVCFLEADESTRMPCALWRLFWLFFLFLTKRKSIPHHHEDHIAGKGENSLQHSNLVHKFIPMPQALKIPAMKAAVDKEWEKLEKISAWNLTKVRSKTEVIDEARMSGATAHFASLMEISSEKCWIGGKATKIQRSSCTPRWYCKRQFWFLCSIHWTRIFSISDDSSLDHGYHLQIAFLRWTSSRCSISLYPSKNGRCSQYSWKFQNRSVQIFGFVWPRHKWPKSWSSMEDPVVPLERNLYGHPLAGLLWERQFEKILLKHGREKIPNWECLFVHREKGLFLSVYVDDIKLAGKKQNLDPMWKVLNKEVDLGEPTSFLDHEYLGCTQRQCEISKNTVDNYRTMFESRIFSVGSREITIPSKYSYFFMVLWHGWSCKEVCGTILWVGE